MAIGENIRAARLRAGLTQKQLGECCGIAEPTIRRYELGRLNPKFGTLEKIANALGITVVDLYGERILSSLDEESLHKWEALQQKDGDDFIEQAVQTLLDTYNEARVYPSQGSFAQMALLIKELQHCTIEQAQSITSRLLSGENASSQDKDASFTSILDAYNKSMVDADTVDVGLMALLIKKNQHCTLEQAKELAEVVAKCIQVGGDSAKAALSFDRVDDAQKPAALAMLRALERNEPKK